MSRPCALWGIVPAVGRPEPLAEERAIVERAMKGDKRAFEKIYRHYAPVLFSYVLIPMLGDRDAGAIDAAFGSTLDPVGDRDVVSASGRAPDPCSPRVRDREAGQIVKMRALLLRRRMARQVEEGRVEGRAVRR